MRAMIGETCPPRALTIGIVNNMPRAAKLTTEAEFTAILSAAADGRELQIRFFALSGEPQPGLNASNEELWAAGIDGLIVTGTEPLAHTMENEPSWPLLINLVDWASEQTISTIWSCLAAQAAVLRLDGITRRPLGEKLSGVFTSEKWSEHDLIADAPSRWLVPHSRYHGLDEDRLLAHGYQILSGASSIGPDIFIKPVLNSLFVMLQGHPEYEPGCLLREYRRDIRRFLLGQRGTYPNLPEGYFDAAVADALLALRRQILSQPKPEQLAAFDAIAAAPKQASWFTEGVRFYARWLSYLEQHEPRFAKAACEPMGLVVS